MVVGQPLRLRHGADPYARNRSGRSALDAAVGGTPDIDRFTVGDCQTETVRALLERAPDLRLTSGLSSKLARLAAEAGRCSETLQLLDRN